MVGNYGIMLNILFGCINCNFCIFVLQCDLDNFNIY
jgi:hypothetical protein